MDKIELDRLVIEGFHPSFSAEEVSEIVTTSIEPFREADMAHRNIALYALERYILADQGGHSLRIRLSREPASNSPNCWVCRRPVERRDWSLELRSDWENTLIWLTWHEYCIDGPDIAQEFDLLSGLATSQLELA